MSSPCVSSCSVWASADDVCEPCSGYSFPAGLLDDMLAVASDILFELSGKRFPGSCSDIVRPCGQSCYDDPVWDRSVASDSIGSHHHVEIGGGHIRNIGCGCRNTCGCGSLSEITLGVSPVTSIIEVKVDGVILDPSTYRIDDYRRLVRLADPDGTNPGWPHCQNLALPDTEEGTFSVEFTYGVPPPPAGVHAAAILGCQLALSCSPETIGECQLPQRVTSITRQGVSMVVLDPFDFLDNGRTGLFSVDAFLMTYNPHRLRRNATVISPDIRERVRRVNT